MPVRASQASQICFVVKHAVRGSCSRAVSQSRDPPVKMLPGQGTDCGSLATHHSCHDGDAHPIVLGISTF